MKKVTIPATDDVHLAASDTLSKAEDQACAVKSKSASPDDPLLLHKMSEVFPSEGHISHFTKTRAGRTVTAMSE